MNQLRASGHGGAAAGATAVPRQNVLVPRRWLSLAACATSATAVNFKLGSSRHISEGHRRRMRTISRCLSGDKSRAPQNPGAADLRMAVLAILGQDSMGEAHSTTATPGSPAQLLQRLGTHVLAAALSVSLVLNGPVGAALASSSSSSSSSPEAPMAQGEAASSGGYRKWVSEAEIASRGEDGLLELVKQVEARVDGVVQGVTDLSPVAGSSEEAEVAQELVKEVWEVIDQNYLDARDTGFDHARWQELRDEALGRNLRTRGAAYSAIRDMLARGLSDPYTRFITPKEFDTMRKYDVTGVGLNLGTTEEFVRKLQRDLPRGRDTDGPGVFVLGLIKGSAAEKAGIEQGDEILAVDETKVESRSPFQVSSDIQGKDGSPAAARITVAKSNGAGAVKTVSVSRPQKEGGSSGGASSFVAPSPVTADLRIEGWQQTPVGFIRLSSFTARAQAEVAEAVRDLEAKGAQEFVLDLRDNRGGLVTAGVEVARLFLEDGATVVTTQGPSSRPAKVLTATGTPMSSAPLTVLVNEHTASASEIFSGAVKDNCRAVLVGKTTYGKGLIQSVYELSDSSGIIITVGKYVTPSGISIDRDGIQPTFSRMPSQEQRDEAIAACRLR